jgi:hypothetical protein
MRSRINLRLSGAFMRWTMISIQRTTYDDAKPV